MITTIANKWAVKNNEGDPIGWIEKGTWLFEGKVFEAWVPYTKIGEFEDFDRAVNAIDLYDREQKKERNAQKAKAMFDPLQDVVETRAMPMYEEARLTGGVMIWEQE